MQHQTLFGKKLYKISDCKSDSVATEWVSCRGRDQSILQSDLYYIIATGNANQELCQKFKDSTNTNINNTHCLSSVIEHWIKYDCNKMNISDHTCFSCSASNSSGDTYHQVLAFDKDCQNVIKFSSANLLPEHIENKLKELELIDIKENDFFSDLNRFFSNIF